jgi:hypothetical protein
VHSPPPLPLRLRERCCWCGLLRLPAVPQRGAACAPLLHAAAAAAARQQNRSAASTEC